MSTVSSSPPCLCCNHHYHKLMMRVCHAQVFSSCCSLSPSMSTILPPHPPALTSAAIIRITNSWSMSVLPRCTPCTALRPLPHPPALPPHPLPLLQPSQSQINDVGLSCPGVLLILLSIPLHVHRLFLPIPLLQSSQSQTDLNIMPALYCFSLHLRITIY